MHPLFDQYQTRLRARRADESTLRNHARTATLFEEAGLDPLTASSFEIEDWLIGLPYTDSTKRLHHDNLSASYRYAVMRRTLSASPMEAVKLPRVPDREPQILTTDELRALLARAITDQDVLLLHLPVYTGMRKNEIRELAWENVKLEDSTITVVNGKGGKLRHVPIHPRLGEVLVACGRPDKHRTVIANPRGSELSERGIQHRLTQLRGAVPCSFHTFRRTVATSLAENDVPERLIDGILGWAPRTVRDRHYVRKAGTRLQEAILRLYADDPL